MKTALALGMTLLSVASFGAAQADRVKSPAGTSATQLGENGRWIEITAGRPIKRGRDLWGTGSNYGKTLNPTAPVWRAGADVSTRLKTEAPLQIGGKSVPAGEYSLFIDLKLPEWTLIISSWPAMDKFDPANKTALWGAYNYTADKDVVRVPMKLDKLPYDVDQLTWSFVDMTNDGGRMAIMWGKTMASTPFKAGAAR